MEELHESRIELRAPAEEVLLVNDALDELAAKEPVTAQIVKLRYFVGMTVPEIADHSKCPLMATLLAPACIAEGPGTKIERYKLLQQIGEGGMGVVYMAEQEEPVRRRVALKIIKLGMDTSARLNAIKRCSWMFDRKVAFGTHCAHECNRSLSRQTAQKTTF